MARSDDRQNRQFWDREAAEYERKFSHVLGGRSAEAWGFWRIPESDLRLLGPVRGRDVLEVGCGAARWSLSLARRGARVTAFDLSSARLRQALELTGPRRRSPAFVRATAERLPFRDGAFDCLFSDWGALTFAEPDRTIPECARVLRTGGTLVFATSHPLRFVAERLHPEGITRRLVRDYFGMHRFDWGNMVEYQLPISGWIERFHAAGLSVERFLESRPSHGRRSPYLNASLAAWARRWPAESIWKLRKSPQKATRSTTAPARRPRPVAPRRRRAGG